MSLNHSINFKGGGGGGGGKMSEVDNLRKEVNELKNRIEELERENEMLKPKPSDTRLFRHPGAYGV